MEKPHHLSRRGLLRAALASAGAGAGFALLPASTALASERMEPLQSSLPSGASGAMVSLECLGDVKNAEFKYLDAVTKEHRVKLSPTIDFPFTGTHWQLMDNHDGTYSLASGGHQWGYRYLDGRTQDGFVQVVGNTLPPYTGTDWIISEVEPGVVTLLCDGDFENPKHRYLDGDTRPGIGRVGLAPNTNQPFSGTRWRMTVLNKPTVQVKTQRGAISADIVVSGTGFRPPRVQLAAEGIVVMKDHAPFAVGLANVQPDGTFSTFIRVSYRPHQDSDVIIRAIDMAGNTAFGLTDGFRER